MEEGSFWGLAHVLRCICPIYHNFPKFVIDEMIDPAISSRDGLALHGPSTEWLIDIQGTDQHCSWRQLDIAQYDYTISVFAIHNPEHMNLVLGVKFEYLPGNGKTLGADRRGDLPCFGPCPEPLNCQTTENGGFRFSDKGQRM